MAKRRRNDNTVQADMQEQADNKPVSEVKEEHEDIEEDLSFEQLGLDPRLIRALSKKSIENPTPIQRVAIPLILEGKDVVARAKTGSGKTYAYLLPLLQKLFTDSPSKVNLASVAVILVPTREWCQQVYSEVILFIELCRVQLKVVQCLLLNLTRCIMLTMLKDVARSITKVAVRESRAQDLRNDILNSEKLKAHFQDNPREISINAELCRQMLTTRRL